MLEPIPGAAIGLIAVTLVSVFCEWVFFSPEQLAKPGFNVASASLGWALSGFSNGTVWLIFGACCSWPCRCSPMCSIHPK